MRWSVMFFIEKGLLSTVESLLCLLVTTDFSLNIEDQRLTVQRRKMVRICRKKWLSTITYLKPILRAVTEPALCEMLCLSTCHYPHYPPGSHPQFCIELTPVWLNWHCLFDHKKYKNSFQTKEENRENLKTCRSSYLDQDLYIHVTKSRIYLVTMPLKYCILLYCCDR